MTRPSYSIQSGALRSVGTVISAALLAACGPTASPPDGSYAGSCHADTECGAGGTCTAGVCDSIVQVGAGYTHTCVLRSGGHVVCWGPGGFAGLDTRGNVVPSVVHISDTEIASNIVEIAVGMTHWCAREATGRVWCWGGNRNGESHPGEGLVPSTPWVRHPVQMAPDVDLIATSSAAVGNLTVGEGHSCVIMPSGSVVCWGDNFHSELGNSLGTGGAYAYPSQVDTVSDALELSAGSHHTCARRTDSVWCWGGQNTHGELGSGVTGAPATPVQVLVAAGALLAGARQISAGDLHTCAIGNDGAEYLRCWGSGQSAERGTIMGASSPFAVSVPRLIGTVAEVRGGRFFTCYRTTDGRVGCFGTDRTGALGDGDSQLHHGNCSPSTVFPVDCAETSVAVVGITTATATSAGGNHACAIVGARAVSCWGGNDQGQLGVPLTPDGEYHAPVSVPGL